jgi:hypothetical protein
LKYLVQQEDIPELNFKKHNKTYQNNEHIKNTHPKQNQTTVAAAKMQLLKRQTTHATNGKKTSTPQKQQPKAMKRKGQRPPQQHDVDKPPKKAQ